MRATEQGVFAVKQALNTDGDFDTTTNGVNMKNYNRCVAIYAFTCTGASNATVTLKQGTSATADTALAFSEYLVNDGSLTDPATYTKTSATTLTTAGASAGTWVYIFEIKADELDTDTFGSENTYVRLDSESSANVSAACLTYYLYEPRYQRSSDGAPSLL